LERPRLGVGAFVGSLRHDSINRRLFEAMVEIAPQGMDLFEIQLGQLPLFNQDLEGDLPREVAVLRDSVRECDGLVFVTPEYNYSIPGVLKNAIDWASWPQDRPALYGKPAAIIGASAGRSGTMRAQMHLRQMLPYCNVHLMNKPEVFVTFAGDKFDADGRLHDPSTIEQVRAFLGGLEAWVRFLGIEARVIR
jgi:chromate reductase, NAD(P)H dehydrogenase (quinone)